MCVWKPLMKARLNPLRIKMLRETENGEIEPFYVDNFEEKQLYDTKRKMRRKLSYDLPAMDDTKMRKQVLHQRQMVAREMRVVIREIKELESAE